MLRFLSSLFSSPEQQAGRLNDALIDAAIERAVDGTDARIRALRNYHKRLRGSVVCAAEHVIDLVDRLPAATEISKATFASDSRIRAFFVSPDHLRDVVNGFEMLQAYLRTVAGPLPDQIFGLLTVAQQERTVFGMALAGEQVRRDVKQVAVNFSDHRFGGPTGTEADTRWELKKRGYDFLLERALARITNVKSKRAELEGQQQLLMQKRKTMQAGHWGLELGAAERASGATDVQVLENEIAAIESQLRALGADAATIESSLEVLTDTLTQPDLWLSMRTTTLDIDYQGIKVAELANNARHLELLELCSGDSLRRVALFGAIPRTEIPEHPDPLEQVSRYLI
jgi:hypothetical protein